MTGEVLKQKRVTAGIAGRLLCARAKMDRSRLSNIERGYIQPSEAELARIAAALEGLIQAKEEVAAAAVRVGWPVSAL